MGNYILKRLLLMIPTLFGVAALVFFSAGGARGYRQLKYAGSGTFAPKEALDRERAQLGLDKPRRSNSSPGSSARRVSTSASLCGPDNRSSKKSKCAWS